MPSIPRAAGLAALWYGRDRSSCGPIHYSQVCRNTAGQGGGLRHLWCAIGAWDEPTSMQLDVDVRIANIMMPNNT